MVTPGCAGHGTTHSPDRGQVRATLCVASGRARGHRRARRQQSRQPSRARSSRRGYRKGFHGRGADLVQYPDLDGVRVLARDWRVARARRIASSFSRIAMFSHVPLCPHSGRAPGASRRAPCQRQCATQSIAPRSFARRADHDCDFWSYG